MRYIGARSRPVLAALVCLLLPASVSAQLSHADLQKIAREAIRNREVAVEEPQFSARDGMLFYQLGGARTVLDPAYEVPDPLDTVLNAQMQVEVLRQSRSNPRQRQFWDPLLKRVEEVIAKQLEVAQNKELTDRDRNDRMGELSEQFEKVYDDAMQEYARKNGLTVGISAQYRPPHTVKLVTHPPGGRIFLTHAVQLRVSQAQGKDPNWRLIEDPNAVELEGKYYYLVQWGSRTVKSDKPIAVDRSGTFVLR